ncbi:MAG: CRTAC1 family protein, partial [Planctomycetaceae bacterium]
DDAIIVRALVISLAVFAAIALLAGGIAGGVWLFADREPPPPPTPSELPAVRDVEAVEIPALPFTDITREAGITFVHENGAAGEKLLPETMGGGCAFLDHDNDGDQDLLFVNSTRWPWDTRPQGESATMALYANDGAGHFTNVTAKAGLDVTFYGQGVACGDYDNDGWVDLFFSAVGPNRLFRNVGGKFEDVTATAGVAGAEDEWSTSCGFLDYDNDGDLDLFVCNYVVWSREEDLSKDFRLVGVGRAYGRPQQFQGTFPYLYRNDGGTFTDVSADAGVQVRNPATDVPLAKSLGVVFCDFDADGRQDIVVANDTVQNLFFHNRGDGTFQEMGVLAGVAFDAQGSARGAMGIDATHFRNDETFGIAIGNFSNEMTALYVSEDHQLQFTDDAIPTGLGPETRLELTFGVVFLDADLDGRLDLLAANGHLEDDINKVLPSQHYEQPPQLFWNAGPEQGTEFVPVPVEKCGEDFKRPMVGRGSSYADIDADGDLDVLIAASGATPRLLRNDQKSGHRWLRVKLIGRTCNHDAIGSWVEVETQDQTYRRAVRTTCSYLSQVELPVTFGLGDAKAIERVTVYWPDGTEQTLPNPQVDQMLTIEQE